MALLHDPSIYLLVGKDDLLRDILYKALIRSFTRTQIKVLENIAPVPASGQFYVVADNSVFNPDILTGNAKVLLLGKPSRITERMFCLQTVASSSIGHTIRYRNHALCKYVVQKERPFYRYDPGNGWNNLGYGRICTDDSIWSIAVPMESPYSIADVYAADAQTTDNVPLQTYCAAIDTPSTSYLWINRSVGTIDSFEWYMVETFFSNYRSDTLPCIARILDIPANVDGAVTMRLDCFEDITSAHDLFQWYGTLQIPFSLAVSGDLNIRSSEIVFMKKILTQGGAILSHSGDRAENWGGSYEAAFQKGWSSMKKLSEILQRDISCAVSPFHENPRYAVRALEDAGYKGFIGGTIRNDPEYLMMRGGAVPFAHSIVSHSQQCMLHGDCMHDRGIDSLGLYKQSFMNALRAGQFFAYLDHPFSFNRQHGWKNGEEQTRIHRNFINFMRKQGNILFTNEDECLDFMALKMKCEIHYKNVRGQMQPQLLYTGADTLLPAIEWKGEVQHAAQ